MMEMVDAWFGVQGAHFRSLMQAILAERIRTRARFCDSPVHSEGLGFARIEGTLRSASENGSDPISRIRPGPPFDAAESGTDSTIQADWRTNSTCFP